MNFDNDDLLILNPNTGETIPFVDAVGIVKANTTKYENQKKGLEKKKSNEEIHRYIDSRFGNFYFNYYSNLIALEMDKQYKFRFIYLCTYMNYENQLEYGNAKGENKLIAEKDLQEVLGLAKSEYFNTKKALINNGLIIINEDGSISVNENYCIKGTIGKNNAKESIRVMENGIKELYKKATPKEHKKLALLIEILPYINYQHNVLCVNPEENDIEKIVPLTMKDLCLIVGYDITKSTRLKKDLLSVKVSKEDIICIVLRGTNHYIYVNPRIYYKGNNIEKLLALSNMFRVK